MTPSAPIPAYRSVIRRTVAASSVSRSTSSASGTSTKSFCVPWPLTKLMLVAIDVLVPFVRIARLRSVPAARRRSRSTIVSQRLLHEVGGVEWQPGDALVLAEPRMLAAGEAARSSHGLVLRLLLAALAGQERQHLGIAEGATGRGPLPQALGLQPADLVDEPELPHPPDPQLDAFVEHRTRHVQADLDDVVVGVTPRRQRCGERSAGQLDDLQ